MKIKTFALTLGLGMVGGAVAATVLPRQPKVRQAITNAADTIENAVETAKDAVTGGMGSSGSMGASGGMNG
jgi:hypothetical protein